MSGNNGWLDKMFLSRRDDGPREEDGEWAEGHKERFSGVDAPVVVHAPKELDLILLHSKEYPAYKRHELQFEFTNLKSYSVTINSGDSAYKVVNTLRELADQIMMDELSGNNP